MVARVNYPLAENPELAAKKDPRPLEPLLVTVGDLFPTFGGVARNIPEEVETILFAPIFFDLVHRSRTAGAIEQRRRAISRDATKTTNGEHLNKGSLFSGFSEGGTISQPFTSVER
jgi:hypothetical protein